MQGLDDLRRPAREPTTVGMFTYLMLGPILWGGHLLVVYCAHTLVCALGGSPFTSTAILIAATALALVPLVLVLLMQRRIGRLFGVGDDLGNRHAYDSISRIAGILSLAGILWSGTAVTVLSSCVQGR